MNKTVTIEIEVGDAMLDQLNKVLEVAKIMGTTFWALEQLKQQVEHQLTCDGTCAFNNCSARIEWLEGRRDSWHKEYLASNGTNPFASNMYKQYKDLLVLIQASN